MRAIRITSTVCLLVVTLVLTNGGAASGAKEPDGRAIFRFDTFGDEQLWTDTLQMHRAIATVSPATALKVGLKVDAEALPAPVRNALAAGKLNLGDPAVTLTLLSLNAVVGVVGRVNGSGQLETIGVTCALCHSTVDNSLAAGVGARLDGWPNRDLDVGAIIALSPVLTPDQKKVFNSWGPGKFDPRLQAFDGSTFIPLNSSSLPVVIPPAYGLRHVGFETFTGDGPISYWNNYVAVTQMGGHGSFRDSRLGLNITQTPDKVTPKLPALFDYQRQLRAPAPPAGSFNAAAAARGRRLFAREARCAECHTPPAFTDVLRGPDRNTPLLHAPAEVGMEAEYASRSLTKRYRTSPLRGIWQHPPYFHDGSARDLAAVVDHYDTLLSLHLTAAQKADLIEFLKSL